MGAPPTELPWPPRMRISLPRPDLLGVERLASLSEEKTLQPLSQWAFIEFSLHRNAGHIYVKLINHLTGSNDQEIDNTQ